jgi:hypothetical protein
MPLILFLNKGSKLTVEEMDGNFEYVKNLTEINYNELTKLISSFGLIPGMFYKITDFRTSYVLPDFDIYKSAIKIEKMIHLECEVEPIIVFATSGSTLSNEAWQPKYPNDKIKYDHNFFYTIDGSPAFGRITQRIDEYGNKTDYDHRNIKFKRYRHYSYPKSNLLAGKIKLSSDGIITGSQTSFTELSTGDVIVISDSREKFYKISSIQDDNKMKVFGNVIIEHDDWSEFYLASVESYDSFYPNNVDFEDDYEMYSTFPNLSNGKIRNNSIGDHYNNFVKGVGDFALSNNVFKGEVINNDFGSSFYNNTTSNCIGNKFGRLCFNNILNSCSHNNIDDGFNNNIITSKFEFNRIGKNFESNLIFSEKFSKNKIEINFSKNIIDKNTDFESNSIGDKFHKNEILGSLYNNFINNNFTNNLIHAEFWGNRISDDFNNNNIYFSSFYDNNIGRFFMSNVLGDILNILNGEFYYNTCLNNFKNNTVDGSIRENYFCNEFINNVIISDFVNNQFQTFVDGLDMSSLNHFSSEYNCRIFKASDGELYIEYFDGTKMSYEPFSKQQYKEEHLNYDDPYLCKVE